MQPFNNTVFERAEYGVVPYSPVSPGVTIVHSTYSAIPVGVSVFTRLTSYSHFLAKRYTKTSAMPSSQSIVHNAVKSPLQQ